MSRCMIFSLHLSWGIAVPKRKGASTLILSPAAHQARSGIRQHGWDIDAQLSELSEDDLKAFAERVRKDSDDPIMLAAAAMADHKLEILERYRTGRGAWIAVVQGMKWDPFHKSGEGDVIASVKCETRPEAVSMARQLLAEHAAKLDEDTEIGARVFCELDAED